MSDNEQSHVKGADQPPLLEMTIGEAFDQTVGQWGERPALISRHQDIHWNYNELAAKVEALAEGLLAMGLKPGERVGIWAPNCWEWTVTQFATAKAGMILVNINPAYRLSELEYALGKVGCAAIISAGRFKSSDYIAMLNRLLPELGGIGEGPLAAAKAPELRHVIRLGEEHTPGMINFADVLQAGEISEAGLLENVTGLDRHDAINIQFTSGTTGTPKGATLTHHNILNNGSMNAHVIGLTELDSICIPVPLYHCFGMVMGNLACMTRGAAMVYAADAFDPETVLEAVAAEKCTALYGVPTMFIAILDHPRFAEFDLSSLRTGTMAGSTCPVEVMKRVISDMGVTEMTIAYGMTETSPVSFQTHRDAPFERTVSTVGTIHPHVEGKIIDEDGATLPPGTQGELLTRGYSIMQGYWGDDEKTAEAIDEDGWMHTGDLGVIDTQGYCQITGRLKDMVIRGGENIYPREVEEFLFRHPKIQDVQVFGLPDEKFGEELAAWICLKNGETLSDEDVRDFCKDQIAHYKIPRYIRFVAEFPMTVTGKIQKFEMRNTMIEELGLGE